MTGDPLANYNLGLLFLRGDGKPENPYRAAQHITYAAEKGIAAAQYDLAEMYLRSERRAQRCTRSRAVERQGRRARLGSLPSTIMRSCCCRAAACKVDESKAIVLSTAAAEKGVAGAQNRLGHVYAEGAGVAQNSLEAAKWRFIAKASGVTDDKLDLFVAALPDRDQLKARAAAIEWQREEAGHALSRRLAKREL